MSWLYCAFQLPQYIKSCVSFHLKYHLTVLIHTRASIISGILLSFASFIYPVLAVVTFSYSSRSEAPQLSLWCFPFSNHNVVMLKRKLDDALSCKYIIHVLNVCMLQLTQVSVEAWMWRIWRLKMHHILISMVPCVSRHTHTHQADVLLPLSTCFVACDWQS